MLRWIVSGGVFLQDKDMKTLKCGRNEKGMDKKKCESSGSLLHGELVDSTIYQWFDALPG